MWRARTKRLDPPAPGVAPFAAPDSWVGVGSPPRKANEMALPSEGKKREASEIAASPPGQDGQNGIDTHVEDSALQSATRCGNHFDAI